METIVILLFIIIAAKYIFSTKESFWEPEWRGSDQLYSSNSWNIGNNWRWRDYQKERGRIKSVGHDHFPYGIRRTDRLAKYGGWVY